MADSSQSEIIKAIVTLKAGGLILTPTDTIWGISCDATNEEAVKKVFSLKQREESKSLIVLIANDAMLNRTIKQVPAIAWDLIDVSEKPTTLVLDSARNLAPNVIAQDGSVGVRMLNEGFCYELVKRFGKPIVSTSPNISGSPTPSQFDQISNDILTQVDYVVNLPAEKNKKAKPSSIIKVSTNGEVKIIRE